MYYPFLRAKKHELLALLAVPSSLYAKMLPILEPVSLSAQNLSSYRKLTTAGKPFILITNPVHGDTNTHQVQRTLIDVELLHHPSLTLGFIVDKDYSMSSLKNFLHGNPTRAKAVIFRYNPRPADVVAIADELRLHPIVQHLVFDDKRIAVSRAFTWHPQRVLISDGFQLEKKNADYGVSSAFDSYMASIASMGYAGFGDYLIVGDIFREGGGSGFVVALHLTVPDGPNLDVHHFTSSADRSIRGLESGKFKEACAKLVNALPGLAMARTTGTDMYIDWNSRDHYPSLGPPKQASMQHHMELICSMI